VVVSFVAASPVLRSRCRGVNRRRHNHPSIRQGAACKREGRRWERRTVFQHGWYKSIVWWDVLT